MKRWRSWLLVAAWIVLCAGCRTTPPPPATAWHQASLGLCEDYPEETRSLPRAREDLAAAQAAGARVLRIAFGWDGIETRPQTFDWAFWDEFVRMAVDEYGLRLIPYVCYTPRWAASDAGDNYWRSPPRDPGDFGRFMRTIVSRYRARIHSWELWNEPDNRAYWLGTPEQFAALVRAGSEAVRTTDPSAQVVLGGIAGELDFLANVLGPQHLVAAVDVVNIHSYYETWHPDPIESLPRYVASAAGIVSDLGGRQALWMAETGYSSVGGRPDVSSVYRAHYADEHSEAAQAAALVRTLLLALATEKLSVVAWYRINDLAATQEVIGDDNNSHLGIRRVTGERKPACGAFRFLAERFAQPYAVLQPRCTIDAASPDARVEVRAFRLRDGRRLVGAWLGTPAGPAAAAPAADDRRASVRIDLPEGRGRRVTWWDATGAPRRGADAGSSPGVLRCALRGGEVVLAEVQP